MNIHVTYVPIPAVLQMIFVTEVNADKMILITSVLSDDAVGLDDVGTFQQHPRRSDGDMVAREVAGRQFDSLRFVARADLLIYIHGRLPRISTAHSLREHSKCLGCGLRPANTELLHRTVKPFQEVLSVQEAVAQKRLQLESNRPVEFAEHTMYLVNPCRCEEAVGEGFHPSLEWTA